MALPTTISTTDTLRAQQDFNGPFVSSAGDVYVILLNASGVTLNAYKATDPTSSWSSAIAGPTLSDSAIANVESMWCTQDGDNIHIVTQQNPAANRRVAYHIFSMSTDSWTTSDELVESLGGTSGNAGTGIAIRSDGDIIVIYQGSPDKIMGVDYYRVDYARKESGSWTVGVEIDLAGSVNWIPNTLVKVGSDGVYFFYNAQGQQAVYSRLLSSTNSFSAEQSNGSASASVPFRVRNAVHINDGSSDMAIALFRNNSTVAASIYKAVTGSAATVVNNISTNTVKASTAGSLLAFIVTDGTTIFLIYVTVAGTLNEDIYLDQADSPYGTTDWGTDIKVKDETTISALSVNYYTRGGSNKIGYVYDQGDIRYDEVDLGGGGATVAAQLIALTKSIYNPTVAPGGVAVVVPLHSNGQNIYNPAVAQLVLAQLLADAKNVYNPSISPGAVAVVAQLIANGNIVQSTKVTQKTVVPLLASGNQPYAPTIKPTNVITLALIADTISVLNPTVTPGAITVVVGTLTDTPVLYNPRPQQTISVVMQLIDIAEAAFNPTVSPGGVGVQIPLLSDLVTVGNPQILQRVQAQLILDAPSLHDPKVLQQVMVAALSDTITIPDPTVLPGGVQVVAQLINNQRSLFDPTISIAGVTVVAQSISQPSTFYNPTVMPGAVSVLVEALSQSAQVNDPRVTTGEIFVEPGTLSQLLQAQNPRVLSDQTVVVTTLADTTDVLSPQVVAGALTVVSQLISNPATVIDPKVLQQVLAGSLTQTPQVHDPKVWMSVLADIIQQGITVYLPDVSSGAVVSAQLLDNGQLVLSPEILPGAVTVSVEPLDQLIQVIGPDTKQAQAVDVGGLGQAPTVELPAVLAGSLTVQAESLVDSPMVYGPDVYFDQFVVVGFINNPATLNGPRIFVGIIPTNWQWSTQSDFPAVREGGFPDVSSDLQRTRVEFSTGQKDLKRSR